MDGGIYLIQDKGELVEIPEAPYDFESILQEFLAQHPGILAGGRHR